ncbi:hypothetical protein RA307_20230 [Xanthobacteraceae bacterium Astr-EGSB]|uniref:hypothetical protein n=1 Tax=Astrobacterium formosum TaxID=3069710 RepID=UPI0027B1465E|nr:hypothetical protein [Xanthobacteraceae bacterium Astr-EGSB]
MSMLSLGIPSGRARHVSLWTRLRRFVATSNQLKAGEVLRRHTHFLPDEMEAVGLRLDSRGEKSLSFGPERF